MSQIIATVLGAVVIWAAAPPLLDQARMLWLGVRLSDICLPDACRVIAWSPDGRRLALDDDALDLPLARDHGPTRRTILVVDSATLEVEARSVGPDDSLPMWAPDGKCLYWLHGRPHSARLWYTLRSERRWQRLQGKPIPGCPEAVAAANAANPQYVLGDGSVRAMVAGGRARALYRYAGGRWSTFNVAGLEPFVPLDCAWRPGSRQLTMLVRAARGTHQLWLYDTESGGVSRLSPPDLDCSTPFCWSDGGDALFFDAATRTADRPIESIYQWRVEAGLTTLGAVWSSRHHVVAQVLSRGVLSIWETEPGQGDGSWWTIAAPALSLVWRPLGNVGVATPAVERGTGRAALLVRVRGAFGVPTWRLATLALPRSLLLG